MKHRLGIAIICLILGVLLVLIPGYLLLSSNKTVFTSDKTVINDPQTTITRSVLLDGKNNPYLVTMDVSYDVTTTPQKAEEHLFSYQATFLTSRGETIEQKTSTYNYTSQSKPDGQQTVTIPLFTLKNLSTDTYALSIAITPEEGRDAGIKLNNFSYAVKSNLLSIHPVFFGIGAILIALGLILFPRKKANPSTATSGVTQDHA